MTTPACLRPVPSATHVPDGLSLTPPASRAGWRRHGDLLGPQVGPVDSAAPAAHPTCQPLSAAEVKLRHHWSSPSRKWAFHPNPTEVLGRPGRERPPPVPGVCQSSAGSPLGLYPFACELGHQTRHHPSNSPGWDHSYPSDVSPQATHGLSGQEHGEGGGWTGRKGLAGPPCPSVRKPGATQELTQQIQMGPC